MRNSCNSRIIAIIGSWGTGKSTVREILGEMISNKFTVQILKSNTPLVTNYFLFEKLIYCKIKFINQEQIISANNAKSIYKQFISEDTQNNSMVVTWVNCKSQKSGIY